MKFFTCLLLVLSINCCLSADSGLYPYTHCRSVMPPYDIVAGKNGQTCPVVKNTYNKLPVIVLDKEFYSRLNPDKNNIAVADGKTFLPFAVQKLYKHSSRLNYTPLSGRITAFHIDRQSNRAVIDYAISNPDNLPVGRLEIDPQSRRKFNKKVVLEFENGKTSQQFDFFNHAGTVDFSRHKFDFTPCKISKVQIKISPFAEQHSSTDQLQHRGDNENFTEKKIFTEELSINSIKFYAAETEIYKSELLKTEHDISAVNISSQPGKSIWEFALQKVPVIELSAVSSTPNYHRRYTLEFSNTVDGKKAAVKTLRGILTPGFRLKFDEIRAEKAVLTIDDLSNPPLADTVFVWVSPQEAVIIEPTRLPQDVFFVFFGGEVQNPMQFDFKHYIDKFNSWDYSPLEISAAAENTLKNNPEKTAWKKVVQKSLPYFIGAIILLLAAFSCKLMRKVRPDDYEW